MTLYGAEDRRRIHRLEVDSFNNARRLERIERMLATLMREMGIKPPIPGPDWSPDSLRSGAS